MKAWHNIVLFYQVPLVTEKVSGCCSGQNPVKTSLEKERKKNLQNACAKRVTFLFIIIIARIL